MTQRIRLWWIVAAFMGGFATAMAAEELILRTQGDRLNFAAPQLHYLSGRPLERLKAADEVGFTFEVRLASGTRTNVVQRKAARFLISYDVIEQVYKVVEVQPERKTANRLSAAEAEAWCIREIWFDVTSLPATQQLWVHMDIQADDERTQKVFGRDNIQEDGISLNSIVETLSPIKRKPGSRWTLEAGPVTLERLRRGG